MTIERMKEIRDAFKVIGSISDEELKGLLELGGVKKEEKPKDIDYQITILLRKLGVPTEIDGYANLKLAIEYVFKAQKKVLFTKELYPFIAMRNKTKPQGVERSIKTVISNIWQNQYNSKKLREIFGYSGKNNTPSNSRFISGIVEYLKMN